MRLTFPPSPLFFVSVLLLCCGKFGECDSPESPAAVDFKTEIRPILSNRCFACHGPDDAHVESGLRLHEFSLATAPAESGAKAIVPKNLSESEMIRRITSNDEAERMPPPHFGAKLTEREIELFKKWIASGAVYSKHWSFDQIQNTKQKSPR
jgi:mono/diheme cytochrome c family protein